MANFDRRILSNARSLDIHIDIPQWCPCQLCCIKISRHLNHLDFEKFKEMCKLIKLCIISKIFNRNYHKNVTYYCPDLDKEKNLSAKSTITSQNIYIFTFQFQNSHADTFTQWRMLTQWLMGQRENVLLNWKNFTINKFSQSNPNVYSNDTQDPLKCPNSHLKYEVWSLWSITVYLFLSFHH